MLRQNNKSFAHTAEHKCVASIHNLVKEMPSFATVPQCLKRMYAGVTTREPFSMRNKRTTFSKLPDTVNHCTVQLLPCLDMHSVSTEKMKILPLPENLSNKLNTILTTHKIQHNHHTGKQQSASAKLHVQLPPTAGVNCKAVAHGRRWVGETLCLAPAKHVTCANCKQGWT